MDVVTEDNEGKINLNTNLYVRYKSFPEGTSEKTSTAWRTANPEFRHKAQFPILLSQNLVQ